MAENNKTMFIGVAQIQQDYFSILFRKLEREISNKEIRDKYAYLKAMIENELRAEGKMSEGYNNTRKAG